MFEKKKLKRFSGIEKAANILNRKSVGIWCLRIKYGCKVRKKSFLEQNLKEEISAWMSEKGEKDRQSINRDTEKKVKCDCLLTTGVCLPTSVSDCERGRESVFVGG